MERYRELMEIAGRDTGLSDYGDDAFREGLEILVASLNDEAGLNAVGEHFLRDKILGHLRQRLAVEDWYRRHPEIDEGEIEAPLFGVSLPRTGSTALSFLLAADPGIRYLRVWESMEPCPPPATVKSPDPRRDHFSSEAGKEEAKRAHTPRAIDGAVECQDLMALDFKSQIFQAFAKIPRYSRWFINADLTSTYRFERRVLKLLQWQEAPRPWRLKAPTHLLFLDALDTAFPDARFVMTHRDPTDVLVSVSKLYADLHAHFSVAPDLLYIGELMVNNWSEGMRRAIDFRDRGNSDRFYDIHFMKMNQDPIGEVRALYRWLDEPVSPDFEQAMAEWWEQNSRNREPAGERDPAKYGIDLAAVRSEFADYVRRMQAWTASGVQR